ncbi:Alpha/Beta hydrolase protein [Protomyces lactucae-debilis]|uniref:Carboxylic ester hydrolase n=1 Tax=Protomyces lactucae-debilis TaxID=2754530 RepID=A0A1Y2F1K2_PROLT|nr:Alpha/Beta hydrolase protein [Protomyces lactucae-debilis]ORY77739.1 Alpha/Beta hydrolase protein [Protomyces lactucae-debilis]
MQMQGALLLTALAAVAAQANSSDPLVVSTNVGTFRGFNTTASVRTWLGIRFGAPANGTLRFRPPRRAQAIPKGTVFNATKYSPSCPELGGQNGSDLGGPRREYGEDCLSLNIWAPSVDRLNTSSSGANVLVWIYGGGFTGGSNALALYNGSNWVRDQNNTIIVGVNYRINMFGFPTAGSGVELRDVNPGLQDQRLAVEWVYNNIANFGGDPEKITLFGQSAGAASIGAWPYAYQFDPIARGLIMQSGSEFLTSSISSTNPTTAKVLWDTIANRTGCAPNGTTTANVQSQFKCLQQVNFTTLYAAVRNFSGSNNFLPTPNDFNVFNQSQYLAKGNRGEFAPLPVLIGTNENEGTTLGSYGVSSEALVTRVAFTCPAGEVVGDRFNVTPSVPLWQYRYQGQWPNLNPPGSRLGSFHSSEISMVFGTYNLSRVANATREQIATSKLMQDAWTVFADSPSDGLKRAYNWSTADPEGNDLIVIGQRNLSTVLFNRTDAYTFGCGGVYEDYFETGPDMPNNAIPVKRNLLSVLSF